MTAPEFKAGIVAVIGRPNAGKSTLVNALVGEKVSIVTPRPQTTQHAVVGVRNEPHCQIAFVDTPGLYARGQRLLSRVMNRAVISALAGADLVLLMVAGTRWHEEDGFVLAHARQARAPCLLVVNKLDLIRPRSELLPFIESCAARHDFAEIVPVSARTGENLDRLLDCLRRRLPIGPPLYDAASRTDRGLAFRIAECVREKLLTHLRQEVPYGLVVEVTDLEAEGDAVRAGAIIWVDRPSHKPIVIGKAGATLKKIGTEARRELEQLFHRQFYLQTHVKLKRDWADSEQALQRFGFDITGD